MYYVIAFLVGVLVGGITIKIKSMLSTYGTLRLDDSDLDEPPYIFLELENNPEGLCKKKYVTLKVCIKNFVPRK